MTILFAGSEMGAFIPSDGNVYETTFFGATESGFTRAAVQASSVASYAESASFAAQDELWVHDANAGVGGATSYAPKTIVLCNAAGTELFKVVQTGSQMYMQYWTGAIWVTAGTAFAFTPLALQHIDLFVDGNSATGSCALYVSGTERASASGIDLSAVTAITKIRCGGGDIASAAGLSQVVVSTTSTVGFRLTTVPPTSAGATTDWTGGYTEVDEIVYSDADFINSATANQVELFAHGTSVPTGYRVKAVIVTARAKRGSAGPANLQLAIRSGGTTYFSSSQAVGLGYGAHVGVWETDPATASAFTASSIASLQFGVKSIT